MTTFRLQPYFQSPTPPASVIATHVHVGVTQAHEGLESRVIARPADRRRARADGAKLTFT